MKNIDIQAVEAVCKKDGFKVVSVSTTEDGVTVKMINLGVVNPRQTVFEAMYQIAQEHGSEKLRKITEDVISWEKDPQEYPGYGAE